MLQARLLADLSGSPVSVQIAGALIGGGGGGGDLTATAEAAPHVFQASLSTISPCGTRTRDHETLHISNWMSHKLCRCPASRITTIAFRDAAGAAVHAKVVQPPGAGAGSGQRGAPGCLAGRGAWGVAAAARPAACAKAGRAAGAAGAVRHWPPRRRCELGHWKSCNQEMSLDGSLLHFLPGPTFPLEVALGMI